MARDNIIKSALEGFFGTYTSQNSVWHGRWLFGFLLRETDRAEWDLLQPPRPFIKGDPMDYAQTMAAQKFQKQIAKANATDLVRTATLTLEKTHDPKLMKWATNLGVDHLFPFAIDITATAVTTGDKTFTMADRFFAYQPDESTSPQ